MIKKKQRPVALFAPSLAGGGAEKVLINLAGGLLDQHELVDIVLAQVMGPYVAQVPKQARVVDLRASRTLFSIFALARYLRESQPRSIVCFLDHATIVAFWARKLAQVPIPIVATVHNAWSRRLANGMVKTRVLARCARHAYENVESVVAVSLGTADDLAASLDLPRQMIRVIYNPVVGPELFARSRAILEHPWFAPGCPPVILGIGRLTRQKDFPTLLLAFAQVRRMMNCRLMILGEGEDRDSLTALAAATGFGDDIALPGFVEAPYKYLAHSSLFVLSSLWEALPTALIEALALGVPVVSTDCESGPREILEGGLHGNLVKTQDPAELADAMRKTLLQAPTVSGGADRFSVAQNSEAYRLLVNDISK